MREVKHLNFDWKYSPEFNEDCLAPGYDDSGFETVQIPHANRELPYNNFDEKLYQFESCYRKRVFVEKAFEGKQAVLHFEGVMTFARVFVNGQLVVEHKGGYTPFKANITEHLQYDSENLIAVYVDSSERSEVPPFGFVVDYLTYGGIYREVRLEFSEPVIVGNCHVRTRNVLQQEKKLDLDLYLNNFTGLSGQASLHFALKDAGHQQVCVFSEDLTLNGEAQQQLTVKQAVSGVKLWDTENPHLYTLEVTLLVDNQALDSHSFRFGFRQVEFNTSGFYLNDKKIKIRGLNRHQSYPYVGYAMPKSAQEKDADILKHELGLNTVRLSHYPQSQHFLNRCDELGLLVFDEIPGWQHIGEKGEW
ncbi:MAG: glycoside hydrolase family 2 protein, partial [Endozoicomonas sp.]